MVQPTKDALGGMKQVDVATGKLTDLAITASRIYYEPVWMPDGRGLIIPSMDLSSGSLQNQLGYLVADGRERQQRHAADVRSERPGAVL